MRKIFIFSLIFAAAFSSGSHTMASPAFDEQRQAVTKILHDHETYVETRIENLRQVSDVMPMLASFLTDPELGFEASFMMYLVDPEKAAPYLFKSLPQCDQNVQGQTFRLYNQLVLKKQPFAFAKEMHDAAVQSLKARKVTDRDSSVTQALYAIGLTGSKDDFALLKSYQRSQSKNYFDASEAALARLGHEQSLQNIMDQLKKPATYGSSVDDAMSVRGSIENAQFSANLKFVPLLCRHLDDPAIDLGDTSVSPASYAADALNILLGKPKTYDLMGYWKEQCKQKNF